MNTPGLLLMMFTGIGLLLAVCLLGYALYTRNWSLLRGVAAVGALWTVGYVALLLINSLTSPPQELGLHERKAFCGFYLDCHLGVSVEEVVQTKTLDLPDGLQTTAGLFYLIIVRASSDARRATLRLTNPDAVLIGDEDSLLHAKTLFRLARPGAEA